MKEFWERVTEKVTWTKVFRRVHLYLGMFITPLLLMYLVSGFYFVLNPAKQKTDDEAQNIWQKLYWVHTEQYLPRGVSEVIDPTAENQPKTITVYEGDPKYFKVFVYTMVIAAVGTMILGIVLAFRTSKNKLPFLGTFVAGILIPLLVLWFSQDKVTKPNPFHPDTPLETPGGESGPTLPPLPLLPPGKGESGEPSIQPPGKKD